MIDDRRVFGFEEKALREVPFVPEVTYLPFRTGASNCWGSGKTVRAQCQKRRKSLMFARLAGNRWSNDCSNLILVFRRDHLRKEPHERRSIENPDMRMAKSVAVG